MANNNYVVNSLMGEALPMVERWLRGIFADEVRKAIAEERQKAKPEKYLSRDDVCKLLGISKPTLWLRTKDGEIKATKVGRRVLYAESDIKKFTENDGRKTH